MKAGMLEHVNLTARDSKATAKWLCELFGWKIRWEGEAMLDGYTVHVGGDDSYVAIYSRSKNAPEAPESYDHAGALNHIGVVVDDLDATEKKVLAAGFETHNHGDYEPGRRFYFNDTDGIEYEVVSYA